MTKKILASFLILLMLFSLVACRGAETKEPEAEKPAEEAPADQAAEPAEEAPADAPTVGKQPFKKGDEGYRPEPLAEGEYKIGIITGTVSQGEEEFQAAQEMKERYGDMIVTATYPDNFSAETETTINQVLTLASDPDVKAIVFVQAVPGAAAAIEKTRETRPDMLFISGVVAEDPETVAEKSDICMLVDELKMGRTIPEEAKRMGAERLIHYSFPRHLGYTTIAARRQIMIETCKEIGIEFIDATAPDPTGDAGMSGAQQFIVEDLGKKFDEYGPDTAFFSTNCGLQEPLIRGVLEYGFVYPQQCCPSPYHAYPAAFNIDVSGHEGDVKFMLRSIQEVLKEHNMEGRMSTWGIPINMLMVEAGVQYAIEWIEGKIEDRNDSAEFQRIVNEVSVARGAGEIEIDNYVVPGENGEPDRTLENFYLLLAPFVDFTKPIE